MGNHVVTIGGRVTVDTSGDMRRTLINVLRSKPARVTVDLSRVTYIDASGLSSLRASSRVLPVVGKRGRWQTAMRQIIAIGVQALPLIAILSACVGFIVAIQVAAELQRFGALQLVISVV